MGKIERVDPYIVLIPDWLECVSLWETEVQRKLENMFAG